MSQSLIFILLALALALPLIGAVTLRMLAGRLAAGQLYSAAAIIFGVAIVSVLALARSDIPSVQLFNVTLLLPASAEGPDLAQPAPFLPSTGPMTSGPAPTTLGTALPITKTATITPSPTATGTATPSATSLPPTALPTETPAATATPTATPEPTAAPPTSAPAGQRKYTVQPGDTLRDIAEKFGVSVQAIINANKLTPQQADSLRVGQELIIP